MTGPTPEAARVLLTGTDPTDPRGGIGVAMAGFRSALLDAGLLEALVPSYRPDSLDGRTLLAWRATRELGRRVRILRADGLLPVVYAHGGAGFGLLRQALLLAAVRPLGAVTILHLHAPELDRYIEGSAGRLFLRAMCATADVACVLTPWWCERLAEADVTSRIEVVPDPLPPELVRAARRGRRPRHEGGGGGPVNVLAMSRLVEGKGVDVVLRAMALAPPSLRLVVAGDGPEFSRYRALANEVGLGERVRFAGWVTGDDKRALLEGADIFCLPSVNDSFCMGFIEAMSYGLPVIGVRWGPIPDVVQDGATGVLVPVPDPVAVAKALQRLQDDGERRRLGEGGRSWVLEHLAPDRVGRTLYSVVALACREAGRRGFRGGR